MRILSILVLIILLSSLPASILEPEKISAFADHGESHDEEQQEEEDDGEDYIYQISAETDQEIYEPGDTVEIEGEIEEEVDDEIGEIEIVVEGPDGEEIIGDDVEVESDGEFGFEFDLDDNGEEGTYTIILTYGDEMLEIEFEVEEDDDEGSDEEEDFVYTFIETDYDWIEISSEGTEALTSDGSTVIDFVDFDFDFYGETFDTVTVSTNGLLVFDGDDVPNGKNKNIDNNKVSNIIAPFWDRLTMDDESGETVYYQFMGEAPDRRLVIEWENMAHVMRHGESTSPSSITFEVILEENGDILFQYLTTSFGVTRFDDGKSASVGIAGPDKIGLSYSHNDDVITSGLAIRYIHPQPSDTFDAEVTENLAMTDSVEAEHAPGSSEYSASITDDFSIVETLAAEKELAPENRFTFTIPVSSIDPITEPDLDSETVQSEPVDLVITTMDTGSHLPITLTVLGLPSGVTVMFDGEDADTGTGFPTLDVDVPPDAEHVMTMNLEVSSSAPPGEYTLTVRAHDDSESGATVERQITIIIQTGESIGNLVISPVAAEAGETLTVQAFGFTPGAAVSLSFGLVEIELSPETTFDSEGGFTEDVTVPSLPPGTYPVAVSDSVSTASKDFGLQSATDKFFFTASPAVLPSVTQGEDSSIVTVAVSSLPGKDAPDTGVTIEGLGAGMTAFWKVGTDEEFTSFEDSPLELDPGMGETKTASIMFETSEETQPTMYTLQLIATGLDSAEQTEIATADLLVQPQSEGSEQVPSVVVNPGSTKPGFGVSLSGTGFTPDSTFDTINLAVVGQSVPTQLPLDDVTVDENGQWNAAVLVPSTAVPGAYILTVTSVLGSQSTTAQTQLQIIPNVQSFDVSLSSDSVSVIKEDPDGAGLVMGVQSINQFDDALELTVSSLPVGMTIIFTDIGGDLLATFAGGPEGTVITGDVSVVPTLGGTLPILMAVTADSNAPEGAYSVFVGVKDPSSQSTKARLLGVSLSSLDTPTVTPSPLQGQQGSKVNVLGSEFGDGEQITLEFGGLSPGSSGFEVIPSTITTSAGGAFSAEITMPDLEGGVYQIKATGSDSDSQAFTTFQLIPLVEEGTVQLYIAPRVLIIPTLSEGTHTVTIAPIGAFSSTVILTATPLGSDASALDIEFSPGDSAEITPGVPSTVDMVVSALASTGGALVPVSVTATDAESDEVLATERVLVRIADPAGDFFLSASPSSLAAARGETVESTLRVVTSGLAGSPTPSLSLSGLPSGVSGTITGVSPIDSAGISTATLELTISNDADLVASSFTILGSISGLPEKDLSMSIAVVQFSPITINAPNFDPTILTEQTPMHMTFPFQDGDSGLTLSINSLITDVYGSSTIGYLVMSNSPDELGSIPDSLTMLLTGGGNDVINMEPSNPISDADYEVCIELPDPLPDGFTAEDVTIAFLDTSVSPPVWTSVPTTVSDDDPNIVCAAGIDHFSSWALLAAAAISSSPDDDNPSSSSHRVEHVVSDAELVEQAIDRYEEGLETTDPSTVTLIEGLTGKIVHLSIIDRAFIGESWFGAATDDPSSDVFYIGEWKIEPHVVSIDPLARFFDPAARITIVFDIGPIDARQLEPDHAIAAPSGHEPSEDDHDTSAEDAADHETTAEAADGHGATSGMKITYYLIDEQQRIAASGELFINNDGSPVMSQKASAIVRAGGTYTIKLAAAAESATGDSVRVTQVTVEKMEGFVVEVPWITVNMSVMTEIALITIAGFVGLAMVLRSSARPGLTQIGRDITLAEHVIGKLARRIRFSLPTVVIAVTGLMLVAAFFIIFAGDKTAQETVGMWVTNIAASVATVMAVILFLKNRASPHAKIEMALAIGLVMWLGSRIVETWFNMIIPTLLSEEVLHHVYPGDFLLTFVTGHDLDVFNEALGGGFGVIYGLFTALKMGGFALFNFHLYKASRLFADRYGKKLSFAALVMPAIFLGIITVAYLDVLLGQILPQDLVVHFGYAFFISMMMVPSTILLVVLRRDTHKELFWVLSTLSLLSFVIAYSWQAFVPVGPNPEQYLEWIEQNIWVSALLFGGDYLLMAFALLWEIRTHKKEHHPEQVHH